MTNKTLFDIPTNDISPNPHNPRLIFDREELDQLKGSISKVGILVPVTVYKNSKSYPPTSYVLLDGERRWRCAKELGLESIPANVIDEPKDVTQNILFMFNIHHYRREWALLPTALKLGTLIDALGTDNEATLSSFTGVNRSSIRRCKALLWYPKKYRDILLDRDPPVNPDFFIEIYPVVSRLSQEREYAFPEGVEKLVDALIKKYSEDKVASDVKEFRQMRTSLSIFEEKGNLLEFTRRLDSFLTDPKADLDVFTEGLENEKTVAALVKHSSIMLEILKDSAPGMFGDLSVTQQLRALSKEIERVLEQND